MSHDVNQEIYVYYTVNHDDYPTCTFFNFNLLRTIRLRYIFNMPETRLFIGNLSERVDREKLGSQLSHYGKPTTIDLKEKKDPDGNVTFRFAYVNIDASPAQVKECIYQLNGTYWMGSRLRIEPAKESFLDRLKRERANTQHEQQQYVPPEAEPLIRKSVVSINPKVLISEESKSSVKRKYKESEIDCSVSESESNIAEKKLRKEKFSLASSEEADEVDKRTEDVESKKRKKIEEKDGKHSDSEQDMVNDQPQKSKSKAKNKTEEEMLSSFKTFSSFWADSDSESEDSDKGNQNDATPDEMKPGKQTSSKKSKESEKEILPDFLQNDGDETADEDDDGHDVGNVEEEKRVQLELLAGMDGPKGSSGVKAKKQTFEKYGSTCPTMTRYDPTISDHQRFRIQPTTDGELVNSQSKIPKEEKEMGQNTDSQKYVKVKEGLNFKEKTTGFSLLAQFDRQEEKKDATSEDESSEDEELPRPPPPVATLPPPALQMKSKPFFISPNNAEIEDSIMWMAQSLTDSIRKEFEEVQPVIRQLMKNRSESTMKESQNSMIRGRGRGRGRGGRGGRGGQIRGRNSNWGGRSIRT